MRIASHIGHIAKTIIDIKRAIRRIRHTPEHADRVGALRPAFFPLRVARLVHAGAVRAETLSGGHLRLAMEVLHVVPAFHLAGFVVRAAGVQTVDRAENRCGADEDDA